MVQRRFAQVLIRQIITKKKNCKHEKWNKMEKAFYTIFYLYKTHNQPHHEFMFSVSTETTNTIFHL